MHLKIDATEHPRGVRIRVINQPHFGRDFFKGLRYFHSSSGFLLASEHRLQAYPRISKLGVPRSLEALENESEDGVILPHSNFNGLFIEELLKAVREYNEQLKNPVGKI